MQTRKWQDKDGHERYTTEIVADRMQMLGSRSGNSFEVVDKPAGGGSAKPAKSGGDFDNFEDDIPF